MIGVARQNMSCGFADRGLRVSGCGNPARRLLGDGGRGVARERSDPMTTLKVGIASYEMKAQSARRAA
jgi:hypothetical protein